MVGLTLATFISLLLYTGNGLFVGGATVSPGHLVKSSAVPVNLILGDEISCRDLFRCRIFTEEEIAEIRRVRLYDVIVNSTDIPADALQKNVFFWTKEDPCPQPSQLNTSLLEPCKYLRGYDYFEVRTFTFVNSFPRQLKYLAFYNTFFPPSILIATCLSSITVF